MSHEPEAAIAVFRSTEDRLPWVKLYAVILRSRRLSDAHIRLYCLLRDYAGRDGYSFAGQARLGFDMGIKERQVRNLLPVLVEAGLLSVTRRGERRTNLYWIEPLTDTVFAWLTGSELPVQTGNELPPTQFQE